MGRIQVQHIKSACEKRFAGLIDLSDLKPTVPPGERENYLLTRSLAAFAVAELAKIDDKVAANAVVDESGDDGIDAFYFDRTEHVCYLVQSKWRKDGNGSIDVGDVLKFIQGINHLLEGGTQTFGQKLRSKKTDIDDVLADARATFVICITYTGQQDLSTEVCIPLDELLRELNDDEELVSLRTLKQKELHDIVAQQALGDAVDLSVMLHEYGSIKTPYKAVYGQLEIADIASWGTFGDRLYHRNLRNFKGSTDVNSDIARTIKDSPESFWYFNNGITITCSQLTKQPLGGKSHDSGVFECKGASVVNGAQTVGSIISTASSGAISGRVLVRLISLESCPLEFGSNLTKATNTQNRIEKRDFAAQDREQGRLRTDLLLSFNKEYVYKTGDSPPDPDNGCTFDEAAVGLACANRDIAYSVLAKREVSRLWDDINQPPYTVIFNGSVSALRLWQAVLVLREVEAHLKTFQEKYEGKERLIAIHGNRFVLHSILQGLGPDFLESQQNMKSSAPIIEDAIKPTLDNLIAAVSVKFSAAYPANIFKNAKKCKELYESIKN